MQRDGTWFVKDLEHSLTPLLPNRIVVVDFFWINIFVYCYLTINYEKINFTWLDFGWIVGFFG